MSPPLDSSPAQDSTSLKQKRVSIGKIIKCEPSREALAAHGEITHHGLHGKIAIHEMLVKINHEQGFEVPDNRSGNAKKPYVKVLNDGFKQLSSGLAQDMMAIGQAQLISSLTEQENKKILTQLEKKVESLSRHEDTSRQASRPENTLRQLAIMTSVEDIDASSGTGSLLIHTVICSIHAILNKFLVVTEFLIPIVLSVKTLHLRHGEELQNLQKDLQQYIAAVEEARKTTSLPEPFARLISGMETSVNQLLSAYQNAIVHFVVRSDESVPLKAFSKKQVRLSDETAGIVVKLTHLYEAGVRYPQRTTRDGLNLYEWLSDNLCKSSHRHRLTQQELKKAISNPQIFNILDKRIGETIRRDKNRAK